MLDLRGNRGNHCAVCNEENGPGIGFSFLKNQPTICQKCLFKALTGIDHGWAQNTEQYQRDREIELDRLAKQKMEETDNADTKKEIDNEEERDVGRESGKGEQGSKGFLEKAIQGRYRKR